ncbi:MAG: cytochrome ubiquinol oxidase subunit I [Oligoflexales bacterium]|nr:cytochrome ubiquinol oxidase subunit I [Oligoflexales bacterium]
MDALLLARIQFALTIGFHYIFPPLTIGMAWIIFCFQSLYLTTKNDLYLHISKYWINLFAVSFVIGVATGITMEFQFGTNWAAYSRFVGDIFGAPLAAEGVIAFFLESSFLGVLIYGRERVGKTAYWFSSLMVALGSTLSAFWIIVANSWQQTPQGFVINNGRAQLTDFWLAVLSPSLVPRYLHTMFGALVTGSFFILGISSYYLIKQKHMEFARKSLKVSLIFSFLSVSGAMVIGHSHAVQVALTQPAKLAAFEGLWETRKDAPIIVFGLPDPENEKTDYKMEIPGLLSMLIAFDRNFEVKGLKDFVREERPPVRITFYSFHMMFMLGGYFFMLALFGLFLLCRGKVYENKLFLRLSVVTVPLPFICNELGWIAAEVGRQPWIVYNLMKTKDAISFNVPAGHILISIILFSAVYSLLFGLWIFVLRMKIIKGPGKPGPEGPGVESGEALNLS